MDNSLYWFWVYHNSGIDRAGDVVRIAGESSQWSVTFRRMNCNNWVTWVGCDDLVASFLNQKARCCIPTVISGNIQPMEMDENSESLARHPGVTMHPNTTNPKN